MAIDGTVFYEDYEYDSSTNEITINAGTTEYITYKKVIEETFTYTIFYESSNEGEFSNLVRFYTLCPEVLNLDYDWIIATNNESYRTVRIYFKVVSEDNSYSIQLINDSDTMVAGIKGVSGEGFVETLISSGSTHILTFNIYNTIDNQRVITDVIIITIHTSW